MSQLARVIPPTAQPISPADLAEHLRLPSAAPETDQTHELARLILAATRLIEARLDMALIEQVWRWRITSWCNPVIPILPAIRVESADIIDEAGVLTPLAHLTIEPAATRPRLAVMEGAWPPIPPGGHAEIRFASGFGSSPDDIPDDLRHAVQLLAAHFYENREAASSSLTAIPLGVASLLAPYRPIRL